MRFLVALLALTLPAFAQIRYSPTGFTAPFISTVTNQASAQAYLGISGGGGGSVTNFGGSATNLQVYSSGTTNWPLRVYATNGEAAYIDKDGTLNVTPNGTVGPIVGDRWILKLIGATPAGFVVVPGGDQSIMTYSAGSRSFAASGLYVAVPNTSLIGWSSSIGAAVPNLSFARNSSDIVEINNGTAGQYRDLRLRTLYGEGGTVTASQPVLDISQTWNNAGVNFTAAKVNVTNTASGSASKLADLQIGGSSVWSVRKDAAIINTVTAYNIPWFMGRSFYLTDDYEGSQGVGFYVAGVNSANINAYGVKTFWGGVFGWAQFPNSTNPDTGVGRNAAGVVEVNNGTAGQYRDLVTRSTFATNASITNITADSYVTTQQTLSYASATNLTVDANKSLHFVSLTNTAYFAQPSNLGVGRTFTVILQQDGTGTRAVTFNTNYWKFPGGVVPTITTNANAYDVLSCISCPYGTNVFAIHNAKFQ